VFRIEEGSGIGGPHGIRPVVVVREPAQRGLHTARDDGHPGERLATALAVDGRRPIGPKPRAAAGRVRVVTAGLPARGVVIDHPVHVAGADPVEALAGVGGKGMADGIPGPVVVARTAWEMLADPFYDRGPNDKGFGLQLGASLGRLMLGYLAASVVAILLGVPLGSSPALFKAANPFIQVFKPISPLAWMPLFLYTIKNSDQAAVFVIFMSSLWPTLANTAFGVASIKRDYLNVSRLLQLSWPRRFVQVILPAVAPAILAGLRISIGSAWVAIVAAEMLIAGTGVGYFVRNEWNRLALNSVLLYAPGPGRTPPAPAEMALIVPMRSASSPPSWAT